MTEYPLKDYSEGFLRKNKVYPVVIVTKEKDYLAAIYFKNKIIKELVDKSICEMHYDDIYYNGVKADLLSVIADIYEKRTGFKTLNSLFAPLDGSKPKYVFQFFNVRKDIVMTPYQFNANDMYLYDKTRGIGKVELRVEITVDFHNKAGNMKICESLDDILMCIDSVRKSSGKIQEFNILKNRQKFIGELGQHIADVFNKIVLKSDPHYKKYKPAYDFINKRRDIWGVSDSEKISYKSEYTADDEHFKEILDIADSIGYRYDRDMMFSK